MPDLRVTVIDQPSRMAPAPPPRREVPIAVTISVREQQHHADLRLLSWNRALARRHVNC